MGVEPPLAVINIDPLFEPLQVVFVGTAEIRLRTAGDVMLATVVFVQPLESFTII